MKPIADHTYLLERFQAKGGWTYARIPEADLDKSSPFGWVRVKGFIDDFEIKGYHLMPMGNGQLFLPVKAKIRKKIGKKEGDHVHIVLFPDNDPVEIPYELQLCFDDEPSALKIFRSYSYGEQRAFADWIISAKTEPTKIKRLGKTVDALIKGKKFSEK